MFQLSEKDRIAVSRRAAFALSMCGENCDAKTLLRDIYCEFMPDKTEQQGELVAEEILSCVADFQAHFEAAQEWPREYAESQLHDALKELPLGEQCQVLFRLSLYMRQIEADTVVEGLNAESRKKFLHDYARRVEADEYRGPVSRQIRDKLLAEAVDSMEGVVPVLSESQLNWMMKNHDPGKAAMQLKLDQNLAAVVTAMAVYTMAQNGELDEAEPNLTVRQATVFACESEQMHSFYSAYQKKAITYRQLMSLMRALWLATLILAAVAALALIYMARNSIAAGIILTVAAIFTLCMGREVQAAMVRMMEKGAAKLSSIHLKLPEKNPNVQDKMERWSRIRNRAPSSTEGAEIEAADVYGNSIGIDCEPELELQR